MATQTPTAITVTVTDRNEAKALIAWGFVGKSSPRDASTLDFMFVATEALFEARRSFSLDFPVPVLSFIAASRFVDKAIHDFRNRGGRS